jgi:L-alanine-DL-glutamate epimerase-like enolase superfamily enzyme
MSEFLNFNRRNLIGVTGAGAGLMAAGMAEAAAPVRKLGAEAGKVTIKSVITFDVVVPQPPGVRPPSASVVGTPGRINVTCVETTAGNGYSFLGSTAEQVAAAQPVLAGNDLFHIEMYLKAGLINWGAIEEAMWDAIGRIAGQPVSRLLGGATLPTVPVYITYTWPNSNRQNDVTPKRQAEQVPIIKAAGFNAMKIQIMRDDFHGDVDACGEILAAGGPGFRVMVDRTANAAGLWTYDQALAAAQALSKVGCYWLEEPLARDDYEGPARLRKEGGGVIITGGEGYHGLEPYKQCVLHGTYDILQPEIRQVAGIFTARKVGVLAETWGLRMAPHGTSGLAWAGRIQVSAAMGSHMQEIAVLNPPTMPDDLCRPFLPLLHGDQPFKYVDGACIVPQKPGLGLNIDETALKRYRVIGLEVRNRRPQQQQGAAPAQ